MANRHFCPEAVVHGSADNYLKRNLKITAIIKGRIGKFEHFRYLSAERARNRWISAASKISPGIELLEDEDVDFLAASMTSQRTVVSDAFDFLFDGQNLNPDNIMEFEEEGKKLKKSETISACCVVS